MSKRRGDYSSSSNVENMSKRRGDYSSSSNEKQKANKSHGNFDLEFDSLDADELHTEVVQKLSESVVSLSFIGDHEQYQYTGLVIRSGAFASRFLTSATAIRSKKGGRNMDMSIHVSLPNGEMARGYLRSVDFHYNIACVGLGPFHVFKEASLDQPGKIGHNNSITAICSDRTGKIMLSTGVVTGKSRELYGQKLVMSTSIIPEFGIGGPLVDSDGSFVGMNMARVDNEGTLFLTRETILESRVPYWLPETSVVGRAIVLRNDMKIMQELDNRVKRSTSEIHKSSTPVLNSEEKGRGSDKSPETNQESSVSSTSDSESESSQDTSRLSDSPLPDNEFVKAFTKDLLSLGYPLPKILDGGMELRNNFEEEFAADIWNKLKRKALLDTSLSVVSLASFRAMIFVGETRFFACTGVLIGRHKSITRILTSASLVRVANKNEIDDSLKIQVLLPNKKHATGKLQHYNLHYNIAVVSIRNFHCRRIAKLDHSHRNQILRGTDVEKPPEMGGESESGFEGTVPESGDYALDIKPNEVVAIGRTYATGKLMATSGELTDNSSILVSEEHGISTCKITKAGIGGPLIDFFGNFIGMNFYGAKRTPYLPRHIILEQLKDFDRKGSAAAKINKDGDPNRSAAAKINKDGDPNRFSVPGPYWWYPSLAPHFVFERRRKH